MLDYPNKEIIVELERLNSLLEEAVRYNEYEQTGCREEYSEKIADVVMTVDDLGGVPTVFKNLPVFPIDSDDSDTAKQDYKKKKGTLRLFLVAAVASVAAYFLTHLPILSTVAAAAIIITIIYFFNYSQSKKTYEGKQKAYDSSVKASQESIAAYRAALDRYETERTAGIDAAKRFAADYRAAFGTYEGLLAEMNEQKRAALERFIACMEEAKSIEFVPQEYYGYIKPMITLLKSGRADSYKEALNMAIAQEHQAQEEAARRAEEAARIRIMEEQAAAERQRVEEMERHNRQMQEQQQMQTMMMLEEQRKQQYDAKKEAEKARREASRAAADARSAALHRCAKCRKRAACGRNIGTPNCGAFDPY